MFPLSLQMRRFLVGTTVLFLLNLILAILLWREMRPADVLALPTLAATATPPPTRSLPTATTIVQATTAVPKQLAASSTPLSPTAIPSTAPSPTPTATPLLPAKPTATPTATQAATAIVRARNGLNLRSSPNGVVLTLLPAGITVSLLPGQDTVDNIIWQQVRTLDGQVGWVAASFLEVQR